MTAVDLIADGKVSFVINTPQGRGGRTDGEQIRKAGQHAPGQLASPRSTPRSPRCRAWPSRPATPLDGPLAAGVPRPRREPQTLDRSAVRRRRGRHAVRVGSVELPQPGDDGVGHGRATAPSWRRTSTSPALGAVVVKSLAAFEWAGNPAPRLHPTAQGMLNAVGLQGPGVAALARRTSCPTCCAPGATRRGQHLGPLRRRLRRGRRAAGRRRRRRSSPSRSTCRARTSRAGSAIFAHDAELSAEVIAATAGVRPAALGQAEPQHRPHRRGRRRRAPTPAPRR